MYKYRLQKWGLDKKLREKEVVQMFLLKQQRDAAGKQSAFLVRGRPVDWEQVQRYLQRRPDLQTKIKAGMLQMGTLDSDLICRSPSPEPVIHASNSLRFLNDVLRLLDGYYDTQFGLNATSDASSIKQPTILPDGMRCQRRLDQARSLILANRMQPGFHVLNKALDKLEYILTNADVTVVFFLCEIVTAFDQRYKELAFELTRHTHDIVVKAFSAGHPLAHLLRRLVYVSDEDRYDMISTVIEASFDKFQNFCRWSHIVERVNIHYYLLLDYMGRTPRNLKSDFPEMDLTTLDTIRVAYLYRLADRLISKGKFEEADRNLASMHTWLEDPLNEDDLCWPDLQMCYCHLMAHGRFSSGKWEEGEVWLKKVQQHSARYFPDM